MLQFFLLAAALAPEGESSEVGTALRYPHAVEFLDRDESLKAWAVRTFDRNDDKWLTLYEAQPAMAAFKDIADSDGDGHLTTAEYRRAIEYITARWAVR